MDNAALFFLIFGLNGRYLFLDQIMIFSAEYLAYISVLIIFLLGVIGTVKERQSLLLTLISFLIVVVLIKLTHLFLVTNRPFIEYGILPLISHEADASFPSRHASFMSVMAAAFAFHRSKFYPLFIILTMLVGISRVYVGVHFPLDILGGFLFGLAAVYFGAFSLNLFKAKI